MKSWNAIKNERQETPQNQIDFIDEIEQLSIKYNLSISHEDKHGAFVIETYNPENIEWLRDGHINYEQ